MKVTVIAVLVSAALGGGLGGWSQWDQKRQREKYPDLPRVGECVAHTLDGRVGVITGWGIPHWSGKAKRYTVYYPRAWRGWVWVRFATPSLVPETAWYSPGLFGTPMEYVKSVKRMPYTDIMLRVEEIDRSM